MKVKTVQIIWHGKEPVFSVDFHSSGMLATAGGDKDVRLWEVGLDADGVPGVTHLTTLGGGHQTTVNCIRFSPTGEQLASGADKGEVLLWRVDRDAVRGEETTWQRCPCRGHTEDVQDIAWAPDASALATCSVDHNTVLWEAGGGPGVARLQDHKGFVQGAAWDPAAQLLVTQSSDRTCRVYAPRPPLAGKKGRKAGSADGCAAGLRDFIAHKTLCKRPLTANSVAGAQQCDVATQAQLMFKDEHFLTFCRRLAWSPDGSFLVIPAGMSQGQPGAATVNTTYVYARGHWKAPVAHLPALAPTVAVRFCPHLFELRPDAARGGCAPAASADGAAGRGNGDECPWATLPYRMLFAVATMDSVVIYDTQGMRAAAVLGRIHLDPVTDLAWSPCGAYLAVSSRDGYCTLAAFSDGDLGERVPADAMPPHLATRMAAAAGKLPPRPAAAPRQRGVEQQQPQQQQQVASAQANGHAQPVPVLRANGQPAPRRLMPQPMFAAQPTPAAASLTPTPMTPHIVSDAALRSLQAHPVEPAASMRLPTIGGASEALPSPAVSFPDTGVSEQTSAGLAAMARSDGPAAAESPAQQPASAAAGQHGCDLKRPADGEPAGGTSPSSPKKIRRIQPVPVSGQRGVSNLPAATISPVPADKSLAPTPPSRRITPVALYPPPGQQA